MCSLFAHKKILSMIIVDLGTPIEPLTILYKFDYGSCKLKMSVIGL